MFNTIGIKSLRVQHFKITIVRRRPIPLRLSHILLSLKVSILRLVKMRVSFSTSLIHLASKLLHILKKGFICVFLLFYASCTC